MSSLLDSGLYYNPIGKKKIEVLDWRERGGSKESEHSLERVTYHSLVVRLHSLLCSRVFIFCITPVTSGT